MMISAFVLFVAMIVTGSQAEAQKRYLPNGYHAQQKINQGVIHGKLTRTEAHGLRLQQARISQLKKMAMADGYISPKERMMITKAERRVNRNIYYQKHDHQNRF